MKTANYNIRLNPEIKAKAENTFAALGLNLSEAINIFLHKAILEHGLPFEVKYSPNNETLKAIQETEDILSGKIKTKSYKNFAEILADVKEEMKVEDEI